MRRFILLFALLAILCMIGQEWTYAQPDPDCTIKGIIGPEEKRLYLLPGHELYNQISVYPEKGERWFCSQQEAERAGFLLVPIPGQAGRRTQKISEAPSREETAPIENLTPTPTPPEPAAPPESTAEEVTEPDEQAEQVVESVGQAAPLSEVEEMADTPESSEPASSEQLEPAAAPDIQWEQIDMPAGFEGEMSPMQVMMMLAPVILPILIVGALLLLLGVICLWIIFKKADQPGWLSLIPFVNLFILVKISGKPGWWLLVILFVPFIGQILYILSQIALAERFGKGALFGIGLIFLPMIFYPILAFGNAEYEESF